MSEQSWPTANMPHSPRSAPEQLRPLRGYAIMAMIGVALSLVANVVVLVATWRAVSAVNALVDGTGSRSAALDAADFADGLSWPFLAAVVVTGIPFLVWAWRARGNAEFLAGVESQQQGRGWVIFGWFVPIVNFWFPYQVMRDIWTASRPAPAARTTAPILNWWWAAFLGSWLVDRIAGISANSDLDSLNRLLVFGVISTVLYFVAGVLIFLIVNQITAWQSASRETG